MTGNANRPRELIWWEHCKLLPLTKILVAESVVVAMVTTIALLPWRWVHHPFSKSDSRVTFCPWCLARLGNHAKGYNKRLHCIASACGSPSFHRYLRSVMPNYFLSFVAPTTVSMEMTWHFFEFRMKHLSAKGEEYSCNLHLCSAAGYLA